MSDTCGTVNVTEAFDPNNVFVSNCPQPGQTDVNPGDTVVVDPVEVTNNTNSNVTYSVNLFANGTLVDSKQGNTSAGSIDTFRLTFTPSSTGSFQLSASVDNVGQAVEFISSGTFSSPLKQVGLRSTGCSSCK